MRTNNADNTDIDIKFRHEKRPKAGQIWHPGAAVSSQLFQNLL
jgi:hypothetical protein